MDKQRRKSRDMCGWYLGHCLWWWMGLQWCTCGLQTARILHSWWDTILLIATELFASDECLHLQELWQGLMHFMGGALVWSWSLMLDALERNKIYSTVPTLAMEWPLAVIMRMQVFVVQVNGDISVNAHAYLLLAYIWCHTHALYLVSIESGHILRKLPYNE